MRKNLLLLAILAITLNACAPIYGDATVTHHRAPPGPMYVYVYQDGSCWADDMWFGACPWYVGPRYGYHYFYGGFYYWEPDIYWHSVIMPPSWQWRIERHRHHHRVMPPRGRRR